MPSLEIPNLQWVSWACPDWVFPRDLEFALHSLWIIGSTLMCVAARDCISGEGSQYFAGQERLGPRSRPTKNPSRSLEGGARLAHRSAHAHTRRGLAKIT